MQVMGPSGGGVVRCAGVCPGNEDGGGGGKGGLNERCKETMRPGTGSSGEPGINRNHHYCHF